MAPNTYFTLLFLTNLNFNLVLCYNTQQLERHHTAGLLQHNVLRAQHNDTPPLVLSLELCRIAEKCAIYYHQKGKIDHSCYYGSYSNPKYNKRGENLWASWGISTPYWKAAKAASSDWYSEIKDYPWEYPHYSPKDIGHFTQAVWKSTLELGIGAAGDGAFMVVVGLYYPGGNLFDPPRDVYGENVLPTLDPATVKRGKEAKSSGGIFMISWRHIYFLMILSATFPNIINT